MIPWNVAYKRLTNNPDFLLLFGKMFRQDEFRPYSYALKFDSLQPALVADGGTPNTGSAALTSATWGAPTGAVAPGPPLSRLVDFPSGAVVLGVDGSASLAQANPRRELGPLSITYQYSPSESKGRREMFVVDLEYVDTDSICAGNPISELVSNPNSAIVTEPPIVAAALFGGGSRSSCPSHEFYVAPGLGIQVTVRSLALPSSLPVAGDAPPNMNVHIVMHVMIPGTVTLQKAA